MNRARRTHPNAPIAACAALGLAACTLLPWYALQDGISLSDFLNVFSSADAGDAWYQAFAHDRAWLAFAFAGLVGSGCCALVRPSRSQGAWLIAGAAFGAAGLLASGFLIGPKGWMAAWPAAIFGELQQAQPGMGWGGATTLGCLVVLASFGLARRGLFRGELFVAAAVVGCAGLLALFIVYPIAKALASALIGEDGSFGIANLWARVAQERNFGLSCLTAATRCGVAWNTLFIGVLTAASTTLLGTLLALMAERSNTKLRGTLNVLAVLPIITPPFVVGLGLILLFGRAGIANQLLEWAFGIPPTRWFYGWLGVWVAQTFAFTPIAFLIVRGVVQGVAPSLEEAAQTLRADPLRTFMTITLPLLAPGLANAFLVGFVESLADFGNPIVVGGQFAVLSTEIFFAIVGAQYDQGRAASLAWVLTVFALGAFLLQQRVLGRQGFTTVTGKGDAGRPMVLPRPVARFAGFVAGPWLALTAGVYLFAFAGGFVRTWGRDWTPTLQHFRTAFSIEWGAFGIVWSGTAWNSFFTTMKLAAIAAPLTAALGLLIAWLLARIDFKGRRAFEFSALLAFAVPGTVLGVSYILAFNVPPFELTGTAAVIVLCFVFRNLPVGVRAGSAALRQIDRSLDEASSVLGASTPQTLRRVVLPLLKPALVAALVYAFVRAVTTVSAVIFLVTAENELATTYIIGRVGNGDYGVALAYCTVLIVMLAAATGCIQLLVGDRRLGRRLPAVLRPVAAT